MKTLVFLASFIIAAVLTIPASYGQTSGVRPQDVAFRILDVKVYGQRLDEVYPKIGNIQESNREEWGVIEIEYELGILNAAGNARNADAGGLYINELEFQWRVVLSAEAKNRNLDPGDVVRLEKNITYTDLLVQEQRDRTKKALVVVDSAIIKRYTVKMDKKKIFWELRVRSGGKTIATWRGHGEDAAVDTDRNKFQDYSPTSANEVLITSEDVTVRRDGLDDRIHSPFGYFGEDSLERIKPDQNNR